MSSAEAAGEGLTVSLITSVLVRRDAISNSVRAQVEALRRRARSRGVPLRLKVYALSNEIEDSRVAVATDPLQIAADRHFQESQLVLFNFGIYYPLFETILLAPRTARVVVFFYGVTPAALAPEASRPAIQASFRQIAYFHAADQLVTTSKFIAADLRMMGFESDKIALMGLPASFRHGATPPSRGRVDGVVQLIYVGRLTPAKGVIDLLRAVAALVDSGVDSVRLELIGSRTYSDALYVETLTRFVEEKGLDDFVRFHFDAPDSELVAALERAHALVIPSYHEGFCIPVIEAYALGCAVVTSDAGALPETAGGLGLTYPAGDAAALADRLRQFVEAKRLGEIATDAGSMNPARWRERVLTHIAPFQRAAWEEHFCNIMLAEIRPIEASVRRAYSNAHRTLVGRLQGCEPRPVVSDVIERRLRHVLQETFLARATSNLEQNQVAPYRQTSTPGTSAAA